MRNSGESLIKYVENNVYFLTCIKNFSLITGFFRKPAQLFRNIKDDSSFLFENPAMNRFLFSAKPTLIELCLGSGFFLFYFVHCTIRTIFYIYCLINNTARTKIIQLNKYFRIRILVRNSGNLIIANFHFKCTNHIIGSCSLYTKIQVIVLYVISHRITSSLKIYYWKSQLSNCVISANIKAQYKMSRG